MTTTVKDAIQIPRKAVFEGRIFRAETKESALRLLLNEGFEPVYMPEIVDGRNEYSLEESPTNWQLLHAPSIKATGRTKGGTPLVVYAHIPNYFSNPDNIAEAAKQGFINGAGIMPDKEFWELVDMAEEQEGKPNQKAFWVDYKALRNSVSGVIKVKDAIKHPQTIAFLGGRSRAEEYLLFHKKDPGATATIDNRHIDDLTEGKSIGRVLCWGGSCYLGLKSNSRFDDEALFVGVRDGAEGAVPQKTSQLEELAGKARELGNGVLVINSSQISPATYRLLTSAK